MGLQCIKMNAAVPLSRDEWRAAGEALLYVKEALADMTLPSIRRETAVMLLLLLFQQPFPVFPVGRRSS